MESFLNFIYLFYKTLSGGDLKILYFLVQIFISLAFGFLITLSHSYFSFSWLRSKLHIYVGIILPAIGLTVTTVIGSNIALSLGMIGALSIVRFRTPVRSPYELVHYFSLLTVGIAAKVNLTVTTLLSTILIFLPHIIIFFSKAKVIKTLNNMRKSDFDYIETVNFHGIYNHKSTEIKELLNLKSLKNYSIEKSDGDKIFFSGQAIFQNTDLSNDFIEKYSNLFENYNIEREKDNNFY